MASGNFKQGGMASRCRHGLVKAAAAAMIGTLVIGSWTRGAVVAVTPTTPPPQQPPAPTHVAPTHVTPRQTPERDTPERDVPEHQTPERGTGERGTGERGTGERTTGRAAPANRYNVEHAQREQPSHNPHVHAQVESHADRTARRLAEDRRIAHERAVHAWHRYWDYADWLELNMGRGSIMGVVRDAAGQPVAHARVSLRDAGGRMLHFLSDRHTRISNSGGTFWMRHVHRGTYRIQAIVSGHLTNSNVAVAVRPGHTSFAMVRIER